MGWIKLRRQANPPALPGIDRLVHVMVVFPLAIGQGTEASGTVNLSHRVEFLMKTGGLEHHVFEAGPFDGLEQGMGIVE